MSRFARVPFTPAARPASGQSAQHLPGHLSRKGLARRHREARLAADLLPTLPEPGEAVHCLMTGRYDLTQVVVATLALKPCRTLRIATLCFSRRNLTDLCGVLDSGRAAALTLVVSDFFKGHNADLHEAASADLSQRPGSRLVAARSHCKVVAFDYDDADGLVFEGSANLRTNKNREQLTAIRDRPLHDWHAGWIDAMVTAGGEPEKG